MCGYCECRCPTVVLMPSCARFSIHVEMLTTLTSMLQPGCSPLKRPCQAGTTVFGLLCVIHYSRSRQVNFICIVLTHSYSLKGFYRPYYGPSDYEYLGLPDMKQIQQMSTQTAHATDME